MEIGKGQLPQLPVTQLSLNRPVQAGQWAVGQLLQATVLARNSDGSTGLQIGNQAVRAQTPAPLTEGARLQLKVINTTGRPLLQIVDARSAIDNPVQTGLKESLPRQNSPAPLLSNLAQLSRNPGTSNNVLPETLSKAVDSLLRNLPRVETLQQAPLLKQAIRDSGLFLESRLARAVTSPPTNASPTVNQATDTGANAQQLGQSDFKAGLLRLANLLQGVSQTASQIVGHRLGPQVNPPSPSATPQPQAAAQPSLPQSATAAQAGQELSRQVDAALARLNVAQLHTLNSVDSQQQQWLIEIPVYPGDDRGQTIQMRVQREHEDQHGKHSDSQAEASLWSLTLSMHLETLGALHARVSLRGERLSTTLWSEDPATVSLLEGSKDLLSARFNAAGLDDQGIHCICGSPEPGPAQDSPALLNERV